MPSNPMLAIGYEPAPQGDWQRWLQPGSTGSSDSSCAPAGSC